MLISIINRFLALNSLTFIHRAEVHSTSRLVKIRHMITNREKRNFSNHSEQASDSCIHFLHKAKFKCLNNKTDITLTGQLYLKFITDSNFLEICS